MAFDFANFFKTKNNEEVNFFFFRKIYLTKTKTAEKDTKDTSTHISQCNSLSLKEKQYNVGLYIMHISRLQMYLYTT